MIGRTQFQNMLASHNGDVMNFGRELVCLAGLTDRNAVRHTTEAGTRVLREAVGNDSKPIRRIRIGEISLRGLAEAMLGESAVDRWLKPNLVNDVFARSEGRNVLEAGTGAMMPSQFSNINAFTAITAGLLESSILEGYENPAFVGSILSPSVSSRQYEGRKVIGVTRAGDQADERQPGMPTKRVQVGEAWMTQPRTVENSLSMEVTQEAAYLDLTGNLNQEAMNIGAWLAYRKEIRVIDAYIGVNQSYNFMGSSYNTFITAGYYDNDIATNALDFQENLKAAEIKFRDMKDPITGTRILVQPDTIVVQREYLDKVGALLGGADLTYRDKPADGAGVRQSYVNGPSVYRTRGYTVLESPLIYERLNAATGLNLSAANAAKYWFLSQSSGFMQYVENMPLRTQTAAPGQMDMIDRGVVLYVKADERGIPWVLQPRKCVRSKN